MMVNQVNNNTFAILHTYLSPQENGDEGIYTRVSYYLKNKPPVGPILEFLIIYTIINMKGWKTEIASTIARIDIYLGKT